ncbi:hypothetical protein ACGFIW_18820 [Micromonospora sp. NPDC048935]|uniref:hypothetical protein n=1 Tax=Micromonospora sp. NPDC048935 TaxID=3364262 RepID=UPI00372217DC
MPDTSGHDAYDAEDEQAVAAAHAVAGMLAGAIREIPCDPVRTPRGGLPPEYLVPNGGATHG